MNFKEKVFKITKKIPKGKVTTYQEVARALGIPGAFRAVGNALNKNNNKQVPCHRVVKSDGLVGGFNKGNREKIKKLKSEGLVIENGRIDVGEYFYKL